MSRQMQDKEFVSDTLSMTKSSLTTYANYIAECSNQQLRQTLQQIRNSDEQFQYQLSQIAIQKGFYKPAQTASPQEIQQIKSMVTS
jgi:spore coat protein CotF